MRPPDPKKRERILTSAIKLFVEKGYREATAIDIAKPAKLGASHIYTYFKDKDDLLVQAILHMKEEHTALSTELAKKSVGLDDEHFFEQFYEVQATIYHRVRFIIQCMLTPELFYLFESVDFDYSAVFIPYLKDWPEELAKHTARALGSISVSYFLLGDIDNAKAASLNIFRNAKASMKKEILQ